MKKVRFVKPETALVLLLHLAVLSCGTGGVEAPRSDGLTGVELTAGQWTVVHQAVEQDIMQVELQLLELPPPPDVDSLHFNEPDVPDSLRFSRYWELGSGSVLVLSASLEPFTGIEPDPSPIEILQSAQLIPPPGLRSVRLSDRTFDQINEDRASTAVEPPPRVTHYMRIAFTPQVPETCLTVTDSLVVEFSGSNADSLLMDFPDSGTSFISVAGRTGREGSDGRLVCYSDSSGIYSGVFIRVMEINSMETDPAGEVTGQARLTSAFLTGRGAYPVSDSPENYLLETRIPQGLIIWTPLEDIGEGRWTSGPGGIIGGLPMAIGSYVERRLFDRYTLLTLEGGAPDSMDAVAIERLAGALLINLDFPAADLSFVEVINPDGDLVIPGFASLMYSRGSLSALVDVSRWTELFQQGSVPEGCGIITGAAEGILVQSLQLDPVLFEMLSAWMPLRYHGYVNPDQGSNVALREAWMKYYLYNTEHLSFDGGPGVPREYSLADPELLSSPLRPYVARGKGVMVLEYLDSRRMLNRLPFLLLDFTHASSGNYWPKICSSLRISSGSQSYDILRNLFYLPGIPQIMVSWYEEDGFVFIRTAEIQPGPDFDLPLENCAVHLSDTVITASLEAVDDTGLLTCRAGDPSNGLVQAVDLDPERVIPADFIYRRVDPE